MCADYAYAHPRKVYPIVTSGTRTCADKRYGWIADAAACEAAAGLKDRKTETAGRRIESYGRRVRVGSRKRKRNTQEKP